MTNKKIYFAVKNAEKNMQENCDRYCKQDNHLGLRGRIFSPSCYKAGYKKALEEIKP